MLHDARGFGHNDFKIELAKRAIVRALAQAAGAEVSR
jgi:xanthine dehydrogenase YagS FAD-binding subunit